MKHNLLALTCVPLLLSACGALQDMNDQMDAMLDTTNRMEETTREMNRRTAILQREQRQGVSQTVRRDALEFIREDDRPTELKLKDSAVYFQAFEFQLWENILDDDESLRQSLLSTGAEEFMISFRGVIDGKRDSPDPTATHGKMTSLLALSGTAEQLNDIQRRASQDPESGFRPVSMLDLIVDALQTKDTLENDPYAPVPPYVRKILLFEDEAKYLLLLRYNMMTAMVVEKLSDSTQAGFVEKLNLALNAISFSKSWKAPLGRLNVVELQELIRYLDDASLAKATLKQHGSSPSLNSKMRNLIQYVKLEDDPAPSPGKVQASQAFRTRLLTFQKEN